MENKKNKYKNQSDDAYKELLEKLDTKRQTSIPNWIIDILVNDLDTYNIPPSKGNPSEIWKKGGNLTNLTTRILASLNEYRKRESEARIKLLNLADQYAQDIYNCEIDEADNKNRLFDLGEDERKFLNEAMKLLKDEAFNSDDSNEITDVHITKDNAKYIQQIYDVYGKEVNDEIVELLRYYAVQPAYEREQILFYKELEEIKKIFNQHKNKEMPFYNVNLLSGNDRIIKPYALVQGKDGIHNYLIGISPKNDSDEFQTISIRLDSFNPLYNEVFSKNYNYEELEFSKEETHILDLMIENHPAFAYDSLKEENFIIRLNEAAALKYRKNYLHRPRYIKKIDNKDGTYDYVFNCPSNQMKKYIIRLMTSFNEDKVSEGRIEIIEPIDFKNSFKDYYYNFYKCIKDDD